MPKQKERRGWSHGPSGVALGLAVALIVLFGGMIAVPVWMYLFVLGGVAVRVVLVLALVPILLIFCNGMAGYTSPAVPVCVVDERDWTA